MEEKRCFKCGEVKPLSDFYRGPSMADGHFNKCKECAKEEWAKRREEHPEAILASRLRMAAKNPTKRNANRCVEVALDTGDLVKPGTCSGCGADGRITAHHADYEKPLDVVWVCPKCHKALDAIRREREGKKPNANTKGVILVYDGHDVCRFDSIDAAARSVGRKPSSLSSCLTGRTETCGGRKWRYA